MRSALRILIENNNLNAAIPCHKFFRRICFLNLFIIKVISSFTTYRFETAK